MKVLSLSFLIFILFILVQSGFSENRVWVFFKDKGHYTNLSPEQKEKVITQLLTPRAVERRQKRGVHAFLKENLSLDLPVEEQYVDSLQKLGFHIHGVSRWFNAVSGYATIEILHRIAGLSFVDHLEPVHQWKFRMEPMETVHFQSFQRSEEDSLPYRYGFSEQQITFHRIHELHRKGLTGKGVIIAMFDTGFRYTHPALRHLQDQIIGEYDFIQHDSITANQPGDAKHQDSHGTLTLSVIGGFLNDTLIGPAFDARFILAKTEKIDQEIHLEEDNWAFAAEWAEQLGVDIVSSSLGYSVFDAGEGNYSYRDMDGQSTIVTQAANFLAQHGVLVVNSAGNEGSSFWYYITAPADGFYVLAVGAVRSDHELAYFSSHGPTFDGRIKPDVVALGVEVLGAAAGGGYYRASGTSLSCPLTAGIAAQILQAFPDLTLTEILRIMRQSGDNAEHPDNDRGWGEVDALRAYNLAQEKPPQPPAFFQVQPPWPNPYFGMGSIINFQVILPEAHPIILEIYTILGQRVVRIEQSGRVGANLLWWNVKDTHSFPISSGIYLYRITSGPWKQIGKLIISK